MSATITCSFCHREGERTSVDVDFDVLACPDCGAVTVCRHDADAALLGSLATSRQASRVRG
jgi:predicted RNA-binding Zn-ribbon protein involved in translation (DUF1610 family)